MYVTRSTGMVREIDPLPDGRRRFDNHPFVSCIQKDSSPWGALMSSMYPTPLTTITPDGPNKEWVKWDNSVDLDVMESILPEFPEEIPYDKRLRVSKKELSNRSIYVLNNAGLHVSPRGITEITVPNSPEDALCRMIHGLYYIAERNTTASLKSDSATLSTIRRNKFIIVDDAISKEGKIMDLTLLSTYTEPSLMIVKLFYCVATIIGSEATHDALSDIYRSNCAQQRDSILSASHILY